jgi:hypothetical protein
MLPFNLSAVDIFLRGSANNFKQRVLFRDINLTQALPIWQEYEALLTVPTEKSTRKLIQSSVLKTGSLKWGLWDLPREGQLNLVSERKA